MSGQPTLFGPAIDPDTEAMLRDTLPWLRGKLAEFEQDGRERLAAEYRACIAEVVALIGATK